MDHLVKINRLVADVTAVGSLDRAEHAILGVIFAECAILGVILVGGVYVQFRT